VGSSTPVTPEVKGKPVTLVISPDTGVPKVGPVSTGEVSVLLVKVCTAAKVTSVPAPAGIAITPPLLIVDIVGEVKVLFVRVCAAARFTKVSVPAGIVIVPPLLMEDITGLVNVLLVNVCTVDMSASCIELPYSTPVPLETILILILASAPVANILGACAVTLLDIVR
jgi:hypothetical protein